MRGLWLVFVAAAATSAAGDTPAVPAPAPAPKVAPLSEAMAQPYFTSGDAKTGAAQFALQHYKEARTAFDAARKTAKGVDAARLDVMVGLCNGEIRNWPKAAQQFQSAPQGLPLLADYLGYHRA